MDSPNQILNKIEKTINQDSKEGVKMIFLLKVDNHISVRDNSGKELKEKDQKGLAVVSDTLFDILFK